MARPTWLAIFLVVGNTVRGLYAAAMRRKNSVRPAGTDCPACCRSRREDSV